ncbi:MAG TPA: AI-2E family transporter [Solirubrobacteraceae bacterium]|nr:AI-2E family transporter [Solirubrobacteraceae bacterium]
MPETRLTPRTVYRAVLLAFALVIAALIFRALITLIMAILIVVIIALPLSAFANRLKRFRIPRGVGATLGLLIGLAILGGFIALIVPPFTHEINKFVNSLPTVVDDLRHRIAGVTGTSPSKIGKQIQGYVNGYTHHPQRLLGPAEAVGATVVGIIAAIIVILLTALYTAIHPEPLRTGIVRVVPPQGRAKAEVVLCRLRVAYLGWLRGLAIGMVVLGGLTYLGLRLVGLQFAAFFAVFTAVAMIIPYFGALASSVIPILYALTFSPGKAILVAVVYILAHQLESNVIQPQVVARTVELHPAVVAIGVLAVEQLFGFVGLIVAVPVLSTVRILIEELWIAPMEERRQDALIQQPAQIAAVRESRAQAVDGG